MNHLSELNSKYLDALRHMDKQLMGLSETNMNKDTIILSHASVIGEAEKQIQSLGKDVELLEASCSDARLELAEELKCGNALRLELEEYEKSNILKAGEKFTELKMVFQK